MLEDVGGYIPCKARGSPPPVISWFYDDGIPVVSHAGVREILPNGTLWFPPSLGTQNSQAINAVKYYCHSSNIIGTLVSKDVYVRRVTNQQWEVRVYDQYVLEGNSAVMTCEVPSFVKDVVSVTSWAQGSKNYYPGQDDAGSRVQMVSTGQLVIRNVSSTDHQMAVRCRAVHTLTGETKEAANAAHIYVTESRSNVPPTISEVKPQINVRKGSSASLLCPAYGYPRPIITWYRRSRDLEFNNLQEFGTSMDEGDNNPIVGTGTVLNFQNVQERDAGVFTCSANNSIGVSYNRIRLEVSSALLAHVTPVSLKVPAGGAAKMECIVTGSPIRSISWLKNGVPISSGGRTPIEGNGRVLRIVGSRATDEGIYQCKIEGQEDSAVGKVVLTLGDTPPVFLYRFIEQTMQPGRAASLKCIASGRPTPSIRWSLDGFPISNMDRLVRGQYVRIGGDVVSHVNISSVSPIDGGLYACTAANGVGTITHATRLNVYGLPVVRPMGNVDAVAGEVLALHCPVGGFPIHSITWMKGGKTLPLNRREKVFANGSLVITNVQPMTDAGSYECSAAARTGETSSQTATVHVVVPPRILPFPSDHVLREGSRLTLTCALTEGDLPLKFDWSWNGQPMNTKMSGSVHKIGDFSSYLIVLDVQRRNAGNYTCTVSNMAGTTSRSAVIRVQVPPRITPFAFRQNATTGIRLQVSCTLEQGDPPISFKWLKDGDHLQSKVGGGASSASRDLNLKIFQLDEFSSVLVIPRVTSRHSGNYTCLAINNVHKVEFTSPLVVSVPPKWKVEPSDVTALVGDSVMVPCVADGFPNPAISWRKSKTNDGGLFEDALGEMQHIHQLKNGSLHLSRVSKKFSGRFLCEATNGIGAGLSKVIKITVHAQPSFEERTSNITVGLGQDVAIKCIVFGDPQMNIAWYKNGMIIQPTNFYRYEARQSFALPDINEESHEFELALKNIVEEDGGRYTCTASNGLGSDTREINLYVLRPPNSPTSLHVLKKDSRSVYLSWHPPGDGNTPITKYTLKYNKQEDSHISLPSNVLEIEVEGNTSSINITNLSPAVTYLFSLIAHNAMGTSKPSEVLQVTLDGEAPGGTPQQIEGRGLSSSNILVSWRPPEPSLSHGKIVSYRLTIRKDDINDQRFESATDDNTSLEISDLKAHTKYILKVQAINSIGRGPFSDEVSVYTLEDIPSAAPEDISCSSLTSQSILASWQELKESVSRGRILGYKVYYAKEEEGISMLSKTTDTSSMTLRDLNPYSNYTLRVAAFTSVGEGPSSVAIRCSTEEDVPNRPSGLKGATSGVSSLIVSWKPPTKPNGNILSYMLMIKSSNGNVKKQSINFPINQFEIDLERNQKFVDVSVSASTRIGEGLPTNPLRVHLTATVPAKIISWGITHEVHILSDATLACQTVGDPRPTVRWQRNGSQIGQGDKSSVKHYPDGSLVIRNAKSEHSGNYSCFAENVHGQDTIMYSLLVQMPPSPPIIHVKRAEKETLTLSWNEGSNGGASLLGVIISFKEYFGGWKEVTVSASERSYHLMGLACGRSYQIFATAFNKVGEGRPSEYLNARTAGASPVVDQRTSTPISNSTSVSLNFLGWKDGGCPISHFGVAYRRKEDSTWVVVSEEVHKNQVVDIGGLRPDTNYIIRVTAKNSAGVTTNDYSVLTSSLHGGSPNPELIFKGFPTFLSDLRVMLPLLASFLALISACVTVSLCIKKRPSSSSTVSEGSFDSLEVSDKQKEHFYATLKKSSPTLEISHPADTGCEGEEIHSYTTIQMRNHPPAYVYQIPPEDKPGNKGNLPNCHFHPDGSRYQPRHQMPLPNLNNYCSFSKFIPLKQDRPQNTIDSSYLTVESDSVSTQHRREALMKSESDEYDTFGSDSDVTPVSSSRKEYSYNNKIKR